MLPVLLHSILHHGISVKIDLTNCIFQVLPTIIKLFASNDRAIRVSLLQHIDQFGDSLSSQIVDEQVCSSM